MAFHKAHPGAGSRPGTLVIPPGSARPRLRLVRYSPAELVDSDVEVEDLDRHLDAEGVVWVSVHGFGDEALLRRVAQAFQMSPLALEDAVNAPQRAKTELFEHHQLIISRAPVRQDDENLSLPQVCFVLGRNHLITFQDRPHGFFDPVRERLRAGLGPIRHAGPDYLTYALIDTMVDHYYPIAEELSRWLDEIEDEIMDDPRPEALSAIHQIRRRLIMLRRVGWPQREMVSALVRERSPFVSETVREYLRDTQDHISQIVELVDSSREMAVSLSEVFLSNLSHRTNEIMKVLTLMASVFIPLTFLAGIYGMNFEYMPELGQRFGYFVILSIMVVVAGGMVLYFRRRGWLGAARSPAGAGSRHPR